MLFLNLNKLGQTFYRLPKRLLCIKEHLLHDRANSSYTLVHGLFIFVGDNDADKGAAL